MFGKARIHFGRKALQLLGSQQKIRVSFYPSTVLFHPHYRKDYGKGCCLLSSRQAGISSERAVFWSTCSPGRKCYEKQAGATSLLLKPRFPCIIIPVGAGIWSVGLSEAQRLALPPPPALHGAESNAAPFSGSTELFPSNRITVLRVQWFDADIMPLYNLWSWELRHRPIKPSLPT